jgi:hypothetical protein
MIDRKRPTRLPNVNTLTQWTKHGKTARDVPAQVSGPSEIKRDLVVPAGTKVVFIGHWVVHDLEWLAREEAELMKPFIPASDGKNTLTYHDADHYGIKIDEADVADIHDSPKLSWDPNRPGRLLVDRR